MADDELLDSAQDIFGEKFILQIIFFTARRTKVHRKV